MSAGVKQKFPKSGIPDVSFADAVDLSNGNPRLHGLLCRRHTAAGRRCHFPFLPWHGSQIEHPGKVGRIPVNVAADIHQNILTFLNHTVCGICIECAVLVNTAGNGQIRYFIHSAPGHAHGNALGYVLLRCLSRHNSLSCFQYCLFRYPAHMADSFNFPWRFHHPGSLYSQGSIRETDVRLGIHDFLQQLHGPEVLHAVSCLQANGPCIRLDFLYDSVNDADRLLPLQRPQVSAGSSPAVDAAGPAGILYRGLLQYSQYNSRIPLPGHQHIYRPEKAGCIPGAVAGGIIYIFRSGEHKHVYVLLFHLSLKLFIVEPEFFRRKRFVFLCHISS